jgi:HEAT repeat protein
VVEDRAVRRVGLHLALAGLLAGCGPDGVDPGGGIPKAPAPTVPFVHDGWPAERWAARLAGGDAASRADALGALAALGPLAAPWAREIAACLSDPDEDVRWSAAEALGRLGTAAAPHADALLARLEDPAEGVRRAAARAAGQVGEAAARPLAARILRGDDPARDLARRAFAALGVAGAPAAPDLAGGLASDDPTVVEDAADALAGLGAVGMPALVAGLAGKRGWAAALCAAGLARLGPEAAPAAADLAVALRRPGDVRVAAAEALVAIGPAARPELERAATDEDEGVREAAAAALRRLRR